MLSMILQGQAGETDECVLALGALGGPGARVGIWSPAGWLCKELVGSGIVPNWARLQRGVETPHADLVAGPACRQLAAKKEALCPRAPVSLLALSDPLWASGRPRLTNCSAPFMHTAPLILHFSFCG